MTLSELRQRAAYHQMTSHRYPESFEIDHASMDHLLNTIDPGGYSITSEGMRIAGMEPIPVRVSFFHLKFLPE